MADTYSIKARLGVEDNGFTSALKRATGAVGSLGSSIKSGLSFGFLSGAGQAAFNAISNGARDLIGEIDSANASWKTFNSNLSMLGWDQAEIDGATKTLQEFAQQTVYSSSDMATTFSQLAAVGVDDTAELVTAFGGLAAAAENPQQAMKTLSQQATQMAAKPNVAWADFKLMLEQTPAGIAAVAREMGMTTSELVTAVQDGEVATEDFFDAIKAAGGAGTELAALATEAKTVGQAMDGLKETAANKLLPAFDVLSQAGIQAVDGLAGAIAGIDAQALADKVGAAVDTVTQYWNTFKSSFSGVGTALSEAFGALSGALKDVFGVPDATSALETFKSVCDSVAGAIKTVAGFIEENADTIAKATPYVLGVVGAFAALNVANKCVPGFQLLTNAIGNLASKGLGALAGKIFGVAASETAAGKAGGASAKKIMATATAFLAMGAAVLLICAGFALLAQSAIALANSGGLAIGVMVGMVGALVALGYGMTTMMNSIKGSPAKLTSMAVAFIAMGAAVLLIGAGFALMAQASIALAAAGWPAIAVMAGMVAVVALLAVGAAALGTALTAGALGFIAFGAALLLIGVSAILAATAIQMIVAVMPGLCEYGMTAAGALATLGVSMIAFGAGAVAAGAGAVVLAAGLLAVGAALVVMGAGLLVVGVGGLVAGAALAVMAISLPTIATYGLTASAAVLALGVSLTTLLVGAAAGAVAIAAFGVAIAAAAVGAVAMAAAMLAVGVEMKSIAKNAKSAEKSLSNMMDAVSVIEAGLGALGEMAETAMNWLCDAFDGAEADAKASATSLISGVVAAFTAGYGAIFAAGAFISAGFAKGMLSQLAAVRSVAAQLAAEADKAVRAKARIASPSKVSTALGAFWGEGFANGIANMAGDVSAAAAGIVALPNVATPNLANAYGGEMSGEYSYYRNSDYTIEVPLSVDGRVFARATASYTQDELNRQQTRDSRKHGRV